MIEEYLKRLKEALNKKNIPETEDVLQYFEEIIEDRVEQGEDLEDVLRDLGEPEQIVKAFDGKEESPRKERNANDEDLCRSVYYGIRTINITAESYDFRFLTA